MDIVTKVSKEFRADKSRFDDSLIADLKTLYRMDNRTFVSQVKRYLSEITNKHKTASFPQVYLELALELGNVAPFIAPELNRLFRLLYDIGFYRMIMDYLDLFRVASDTKTLMMMHDLLSKRDIGKIYNGVEVYKLKKTVIELSGKFRSKKEVVENFDVQLAPLFLDWADYPQV